MVQTEDEIVVGNVYKKYTTKNPLMQLLMNNYLKNLD